MGPGEWLGILLGDSARGNGQLDFCDKRSLIYASVSALFYPIGEHAPLANIRYWGVFADGAEQL